MQAREAEERRGGEKAVKKDGGKEKKDNKRKRERAVNAAASFDGIRRRDWSDSESARRFSKTGTIRRVDASGASMEKKLRAVCVTRKIWNPIKIRAVCRVGEKAPATIATREFPPTPSAAPPFLFCSFLLYGDPLYPLPFL